MLILPTQDDNPALDPAPAGSIQFVCALLFSSLVLKEQVRLAGGTQCSLVAISETYIDDDPITVKERPTASRWPAAASCPQRAPSNGWCP